jgi:signal transduction histidine kinase
MNGPTPVTDRPIEILLIDDDEDDYYLTKQVLSDISHASFNLQWIWKFEEGFEAIRRGEHDIYLLDYRLGEKSGLELLKEARALGCKSPIILLTGQSSTEIDLAAMDAGATDFLEKSRLEAAVLDRTIRYALQQRQYETQLEKKVAERTEELARANEALRLADKRKDEFLATLAHELRNPLAPIRNALEIMRIAADNPTTIEKARLIMERQTHTLIRLIDDLLDISRITRSKLTLDLDLLLVREIIDLSLETSQPLLDKAGITLDLEMPERELKVRGDRLRLAQVFSNLLNNAAKYTKRGGRVCLKVTQSDSFAAICVQDTGVGIPPEMVSQIFELFTQVDRSLNRSQGGLGIGLSLVKKLVEMHGGSVQARSEGIEKGTEILVKLPLIEC